MRRRILVGLALAVFAAGAWGGISAGHALRDSRRAAELRSAYGAIRYAAMVERTALRGTRSHSSRSRADFFAGARGVAAGLARLEANAGGPDLPRVRQVAALNARAVERGARYFARRSDAQRASVRRELDATLRSLATEARRGSADFNLRDAGRWPASTTDRAALAALALVYVVGLGVIAFAIVRLLAARRRPLDERNIELERLEEAALTDNLTGLRNHRAFQEDLKREIERRNRTGTGFALAMIDMNGLKQINDSQGHQVGDARIKAVAQCLKTTVRGSDLAYRIGGDEFVVVLPAQRAWGALTLAHRLHSETMRAGAPVSVGIAESIKTESRDSLIKQADLALYEAKHTHRQTVVFSPGLEPHQREEDVEAHRQHEKLLATALARAVDAKDAGTRNHCETVAEICALMGANLGLESERIPRVRLAGLLHDVGKIGIADAILQKPSKLAREERTIMSTHTVIGYNIVAAAGLEEEAQWVLHHHERWDGQGYPDGLAGDAIPLESRIILVADAFEAITADRPYRRGRSPEEALQELVLNAGAQFDPRCVDALCAVYGHTPSVPIADVDELRARRLARAQAPDQTAQTGLRAGA